MLSIVYRRKEREFQDRLRETSDPHVVYVTDLVACSQKRLFRIRMPFLSFRFEPSMVVGELVHQGLESILSEEGWLTEYDVEKVVRVNDEEYRLKGRVDAVYATEGRVEKVLEIKFARSVDKPLEHHVLQLRVYMNLLDAHNGILVYITPDKILEFNVPYEKVNIELLVKETVLNLATPRFEWECRFCPYRRFCPYASQAEESKRRP